MKFCDLNCGYAAWPEEDSLDGSGSCRTFQAVYCKKKDQHVHKNMPCHEKTNRHRENPDRERENDPL